MRRIDSCAFADVPTGTSICGRADRIDRYLLLHAAQIRAWSRGSIGRVYTGSCDNNIGAIIETHVFNIIFSMWVLKNACSSAHTAVRTSRGTASSWPYNAAVGALACGKSYITASSPQKTVSVEQLLHLHQADINHGFQSLLSKYTKHTSQYHRERHEAEKMVMLGSSTHGAEITCRDSIKCGSWENLNTSRKICLS